MPLSEPYSGSSSISTTEFSLTDASTAIQSQTADGVYQLVVDGTNVTVAEAFLVFLREKVSAGGTQRQSQIGTITPGKVCVFSPHLLIHGWDYTIQRDSTYGGSDRTIGWSIRKTPAVVTEIGTAGTVSTSKWSFTNGSTSIATNGNEAIVQLFLDCPNNVAGDEFTVFFRDKIRSADSAASEDMIGHLTGVVPGSMAFFEPIHAKHAWDCTAIRTAGSDRAITPSIRQAA